MKRKCVLSPLSVMMSVKTKRESALESNKKMSLLILHFYMLFNLWCMHLWVLKKSWDCYLNPLDQHCHHSFFQLQRTAKDLRITYTNTQSFNHFQRCYIIINSIVSVQIQISFKSKSVFENYILTDGCLDWRGDKTSLKFLKWHFQNIENNYW